MASIQAVARRREARKARSVIRQGMQRKSHWRDRQQKDREKAEKMVRRFFPQGAPHMMVLRYEYWQARRCGWDLLKPQWTRSEAGALCDPWHGVIWNWWHKRHYETRDFLVRHSTYRLVRQ